MKLLHISWCPTLLFVLGSVGQAQCEIDMLTVGDAASLDIDGWSVEQKLSGNDSQTNFLFDHSVALENVTASLRGRGRDLKPPGVVPGPWNSLEAHRRDPGDFSLRGPGQTM